MRAEFVRQGGLISNGADLTDIFRRAAGYVDRILRAGRPAGAPKRRLVRRSKMSAIGREAEVACARSK
jgi:ABC-type uncharacterized transport system substrate-binding protein